MGDYKKALEVDVQEAEKYFRSSIEKKTEQQKFLEQLLAQSAEVPKNIADIACGGGGATLHLSKIYPESAYSLIDINEKAISIARDATSHINAKCYLGDIYNIELCSDSFDLVVCWQTLSWLDFPEKALSELIRICKKGGRVFVSSLFNLDHDVDIYSKVFDKTRPSSAENVAYSYNTYSKYSVENWTAGLVTRANIHKFVIPVDLSSCGRGLGTYTIKTDCGERLQFSAGMLLNWGVLEIVK